jgi:F0F1-type ATP synthase assembly protein I
VPLSYIVRENNTNADSRKEGITAVHLKAMLIGGGIFGPVGAFFGYMVGLTGEGAGIGFVLGWVVGEIAGLTARSSLDE